MNELNDSSLEMSSVIEDELTMKSPGRNKLPALQGKPRSSSVKEKEDVSRLESDEASFKISTDSAKIKQLKEERVRMVQYISGVQRNYEALSEFCYKSQSQVFSLQKQVETQKSISSNLVDELNGYKTIQSELEKEQEQSNELREECEKVKSKLKTLLKTLEDRNDHLQEALNSNENLQQEVVRLREAAQRNHSQVIVSQQQLQDDQTLILRRERRNMQLEGLLNERNNELGILKEKLKTLETNIQKTENLYRRAVIDRDNIRSDYNRVKSRTIRIESQLRESTATLLQAEEVRKGLIMDLKTLQSRSKDFENLPHDILIRYQQSQTLCRELEFQLKRSNQIGQESENELEGTRDQLGQYRLKVTSLKTDLVEMQSENEALKRSLAHLSDMLDKTQAELRNSIVQAQELAAVQAENTDLRQMVADIQRQRAIWMEEIRRALDTSKGHEKLFNELESSNIRLKDTQKDLREKFANVSKEKDLLQKEVKTVEAERERLEKEARELRESMNKMKSAFEKDSKQLHEEVNVTLKTLHGQLAQLKRDLIDKEKHILDLESRKTFAPSELKAMEDRKRELHNTVSKLVNAEEASEPAYTCYICMKPFNNPVTCIPCGHSFCEGCLVKANRCTQCGDKSKDISFYPNQLLGQLSAKYVYRKQVLQGLLSLGAEQ